MSLNRSLFLFPLIACVLAPAWAQGLIQPDPGKKIHVFLFAGQSNMEGRANGRDLLEADRNRLRAVQDRVQLAYNRKPLGPLDVVEPPDDIRELYKVDRIFGPELFFGIALAEAMPKEKFLFIKRAAGSTTLYGAWNPDYSEEKAAAVGGDEELRLYGDLVAYTREILAEYQPEDYAIEAMLWVQGEGDGKVEVAAASYGQNLRTLIERIRSDMSTPHLPFMLLQVGAPNVVEGMKQTAAELPRVTFLPQSQDPSSPEFLHKMENGHYDYEGMKRLGQRFAECYLNDYAGTRR